MEAYLMQIPHNKSVSLIQCKYYLDYNFHTNFTDLTSIVDLIAI